MGQELGAISAVGNNDKTNRATPLKKMMENNFAKTLASVAHNEGAKGPSIFGDGFAANSSSTGAANVN